MANAVVQKLITEIQAFSDRKWDEPYLWACLHLLYREIETGEKEVAPIMLAIVNDKSLRDCTRLTAIAVLSKIKPEGVAAQLIVSEPMQQGSKAGKEVRDAIYATTEGKLVEICSIKEFLKALDVALLNFGLALPNALALARVCPKDRKLRQRLLRLADDLEELAKKIRKGLPGQ